MTEKQAIERADLITKLTNTLFTKGEVEAGKMKATYKNNKLVIDGEEYKNLEKGLDKLLPPIKENK